MIQKVYKALQKVNCQKFCHLITSLTSVMILYSAELSAQTSIQLKAPRNSIKNTSENGDKPTTYFDFKSQNSSNQQKQLREWLKDTKTQSLSIDKTEQKSLGGSDAGGGLGHHLELLDFAEARNGSGRIPFNPSELTILQEPLSQILQNGLTKAPEFQDFILNLLSHSKRNWFFVNGSLNSYLNVSNLHVLMSENLKGEVVAVQNDTTVLIKLPWLLKTNSKLEQIGLFVHEALMSVALDYKLPHDNVRAMNRVVFAKYFGGSFPNDFELLLNQLGFLLPLQDYLKWVGEYSDVVTINSLLELKKYIEAEEAGASEFVRIEPWPRGQSKIVFKELKPAQISKGEIIVNDVPLENNSLRLLWSGYLYLPSLVDSFKQNKIVYIYRRN